MSQKQVFLLLSLHIQPLEEYSETSSGSTHFKSCLPAITPIIQVMTQGDQRGGQQGVFLEGVPTPGMTTNNPLNTEVTAHHTNMSHSLQTTYVPTRLHVGQIPKCPCHLSTTQQKRKCDGGEVRMEQGPGLTNCGSSISLLQIL